ncbi:MAG: hypothetical protein OEY89_06340 [Gammaproteobacteria bacterium]|nr:hypothetical protein [Gammaproteobacteria bacterium]
MSKISQSDVIAAIEVALEMSPGSLTENSRAEEIDNWDSLGLLSILVALDKALEGKVSGLTEMSEADSVPKIIEILRHHSLIE